MGESLSLSIATFGSGQTIDENGNLYYWFNPSDVLFGLTGGKGAEFQFWCSACSGQWTPQLVSAASLVASEPPVFPCLTPENVSFDGLCSIASQWLYSSFWRALTGGNEFTCGENPA